MPGVMPKKALRRRSYTGVQRDELQFPFHGGGSVLAGEPEDFDAGNGVEVWVAMHEDETRRVRDSGDESIGQGQTAWCGIAQTDRGEGGFRVHGQEGGQADGVLQEDILPLCHLGH